MTATIDRTLDVLVVDDEPDVRELLVEFFRDLGFRVAAASDGRAAITAIERAPTRFWLVLTDIIMPGADGLAVLRAAKAANPAIHVVIVTGYASLDSAVEAVRLGASDYVSKPFTLGQIEVVTQRLTERLALEEENRQLTRRVQRDGAAGTDPPIERLDAIDLRLGRVEKLLQHLVESDERDG